MPARAAILALAAVAGPLASASAAGPPTPVRVGHAPRVPRGARAVGPVSASSGVSGAVVLKPREDAALTRFIAEVSDKGSPRFGQYLAPGAFASRYGPTAATIDAVETQLHAAGLRVSSVSSDHLLVGFTGSAAQVERAFRTGLESYRLADGRIAREATAAAAVQASIAGSVVGVLGLSDSVREHPAGLARAPAAARRNARKAKSGTFAHPAGSPTPCRNASADAVGFGGLTDDQIANAYGAFGLYTAGDLGAGQHVGIYELEQFAPSDIHHFDSCYFGSAQAASMAGRLSVIPVDGGQPAGAGEVEADLDVEDVSAMAPGASIDVYEAPNDPAGAIDEWAAIVNADRERVITTSWGDCEQELQLGEPGIQQAENFLFEQAAAQGQTVFAAAGDEGSDDCNAFEVPENVPGQNPLSVDDPGSQPYVVSAGGTTITDAASEPAEEQVWNDGPEGGAGGGGLSMSWAMPSWQIGAKVPGVPLPGGADYTNADPIEQSFGYPQNFCQSFLPDTSATTPCRAVPDISAQADEFTGAVTIYSKAFKEEEPDGWITIGGTSSAAPIWAAMLTEINASSSCAGQPATAAGVGFAAPALRRRLQPGAVRRVIQRHHRRRQRHLRPRGRPRVSGHARLRPRHGARLAAPHRRGRQRRARLLPVQPRRRRSAARRLEPQPQLGRHGRGRDREDRRQRLRRGRRRAGRRRTAGGERVPRQQLQLDHRDDAAGARHARAGLARPTRRRRPR